MSDARRTAGVPKGRTGERRAAAHRVLGAVATVRHEPAYQNFHHGRRTRITAKPGQPSNGNGGNGTVTRTV